MCRPRNRQRRSISASPPCSRSPAARQIHARSQRAERRIGQSIGAAGRQGERVHVDPESNRVRRGRRPAGVTSRTIRRLIPGSPARPPNATPTDPNGVLRFRTTSMSSSISSVCSACSRFMLDPASRVPLPAAVAEQFPLAELSWCRRRLRRRRGALWSSRALSRRLQAEQGARQPAAS